MTCSFLQHQEESATLLCHAGDAEPVLPVIMANWHHDKYFHATVTHVEALTDDMRAAPVGSALTAETLQTPGKNRSWTGQQCHA